MFEDLPLYTVAYVKSSRACASCVWFTDRLGSFSRDAVPAALALGLVESVRIAYAPIAKFAALSCTLLSENKRMGLLLRWIGRTCDITVFAISLDHA